MLHRKGLVRAAAIAALACAGICRAETAETVSASDDGLSLKPAYLQVPAPAPAPPPPIPNPLMILLGNTPLGAPLTSANITMSGFVDAGYTASMQHPADPPGAAGDVNIAGRFQDNKSEHIVFDQLDFAIARPADLTKYDIGATFEFVYGRDAAFFHSTGIYDNPDVLGGRPDPYYKSVTSPEDQADIAQAFLEFSLPWGPGVRIRAGKFYTLIGMEVISPTGNTFYSHSYLFTYAIPLTNTGIWGEYKATPDWQFDAAITRGWNQSIKDNNGDPDMIGMVTYTPQESPALQMWKFILDTEIGPEATHDNSDWWTVIDLQAVYTNGPVVASLNADYGDAPHAFPGHSAEWGGVAGYVVYTPPNQTFVAINTRLEWYQDAQSFTVAGFVDPTGGPVTGTENLYEATIGAAITWFPDDPVMKNLVFRPEVRFDYASKDFFNGDTKHFQSTFGIDVYFKY